MRLICLTMSFFFAGVCHAGIVYSNSYNSSSTVTVLKGDSRGQTFTNGSSAAQMVSVTIYLKNTGAAAGNILIGIRSITGTPGSDAVGVPTTGGLLASSDTINASTISTTSITALTFGFTSSNTTLAANTSYSFVINVSGLTAGSLTAYYGSQLAGQNSFRTNTNPYTADNTNDLAGQVDVTAVPEPGTLILSGFALAVGAACVWMKRRRKSGSAFPMLV